MFNTHVWLFSLLPQFEKNILTHTHSSNLNSLLTLTTLYRPWLLSEKLYNAENNLRRLALMKFNHDFTTVILCIRFNCIWPVIYHYTFTIVLLKYLYAFYWSQNCGNEMAFNSNVLHRHVKYYRTLYYLTMRFKFQLIFKTFALRRPIGLWKSGTAREMPKRTVLNRSRGILIYYTAQPRRKSHVPFESAACRQLLLHRTLERKPSSISQLYHRLTGKTPRYISRKMGFEDFIMPTIESVK